MNSLLSNAVLGWTMAPLLLWGAAASRGQADEPAAGLIAHWKLAGDSQDHSGNQIHGKNHGVDLSASAGKVGRVGRFDGRRQFIEAPAHPQLKLGKKDFTIALWLFTDKDGAETPGDLVSMFDPKERRGFSLSLTNRSGVTHSQANHRNVHFGIDHGQENLKWVDRGRPGNAVYVQAMAVHQGHLYAGTCEPGKGQAGHVYRFAGGDQWTDCGRPDLCNSVSTLAQYRGHLYAGVAKYRLGGSALPESENPNLGGKVYRYEGDQRWTDCGQLPGAEAVGGMVVFKGQLYASSLYKPAGFYRFDGNKTWVDAGTPNAKRVEALGVFQGQIFATGYDEGHVYRYDGAKWTDCGKVGENTQTYAFAIHQGDLYVSTWPSGRVFRYRGDNDWVDVGRLGQELEVMGMLVHNGKLFAGTLPLAAVYRFDGPDAWTNTGQLDLTPKAKYRRAWTMAEFQGQLFCGTLPSGRVWSLEAGKNVTYDHEFPPGWQHLAAVREGGRLKLYLNGKLIAAAGTVDAPALDLGNPGPLRIGFGPNNYFTGNLRDVRLYGRALSEANVAKLAAP